MSDRAGSMAYHALLPVFLEWKVYKEHLTWLEEVEFKEKQGEDSEAVLSELEEMEDFLFSNMSTGVLDALNSGYSPYQDQFAPLFSHKKDFFFPDKDKRGQIFKELQMWRTFDGEGATEKNRDRGGTLDLVHLAIRMHLEKLEPIRWALGYGEKEDLSTEEMLRERIWRAGLLIEAMDRILQTQQIPGDLAFSSSQGAGKEEGDLDSLDKINPYGGGGVLKGTKRWFSSLSNEYFRRQRERKTEMRIRKAQVAAESFFARGDLPGFHDVQQSLNIVL